MTSLWLADELIEATGGRPFGTMPAAVTGISIDTRSLTPGDAFFAIRGDSMDGHDFATAAVKAGASLLVVAESKLPALGRLTAPMIVVPDVLAALEKAGAAARARSAAKIVAVTGSAGKTSTKEALRHALSAVGKVHASAASFNNHWGVPLTLARMPADCDYAVFEIGMNHEGEIRPLVGMVKPHVAIVTLVGAAHLGHFSSLDDIARAKAEIFEGVVPGGAALINRDDERWPLLSGLAREAGIGKVFGFGENENAVYRLTNVSLHPDHSLISATIAGREVVARVGAPGRHVVQNALAVLGAADLMGADVGKVAEALANLAAEPGRGKRHVLGHPGGPITLIDESYNANPTSMKAAIDLLAATPVTGEGRRIAVLGDMLELGAHSAKLHAALAGLLGSTAVDVILLAGPEMKALADALPEGADFAYRSGAGDLKPVLIETVRPGDVVMVKSSKSIGFSKLVDALILQFPADAGSAKPS
ncbi:UDP-N-acetylmuramoylalanyl-D-glutamyl-2,6-diaminopimelate--D-alanyl-D-alanine ligase [Mesorhizobium marinum]|uniref:UDP-N-acetylmuramoylalanyl-D-glutamyl-2, 6-diaminopimelate--D-alanyl-D-alanine ligase n=1 Tax=Mesorhizobium marinum TaxID=3228790 RepID=UPI00346636D1